MFEEENNIQVYPVAIKEFCYLDFQQYTVKHVQI